MESTTASTENTPSVLRRITAIGGKFAIVVWAIGLSVVISALMVAHWVTLPMPEMGSRVNAGLISDVSDRDQRLRVIHVMNLQCPCSKRVLRTLLERTPINGTHEKILFVGSDPEFDRQATQKGFATESVKHTELKERFGIESSPMMLVVDHSGTIRYSGGYTSRKQGLDVQDVSIIKTLLEGQSVESLPIYGCAVSRSLRKVVDPLQLKYEQE
ncbi:thioredoxin family protein [Stieleria sp. JC731]|uniref:thioredoxin family protein n=1 Tax=Pirellulaceae TaxID=2691357 RepID=UPI001E5A0478|nr:thioredoxin family protein [Stieleria sp. JC731]MCC9604009.1 thioredoxin family protein [Stieleria sp. JC731]